MAAKPLPQALPLRDAIAQSAPLAQLARRLQESKARYETVRERLPPALRPLVQPGPVDETGWTLLVANPAVGAKLRHLVPLLLHALQDAGWPAVPIRIKVRGSAS